MPPVLNESAAFKESAVPRLFLLDACSLRSDLGVIVEYCRGHSPGSKFLALLPPSNAGHAEMLRLFHWGIEGFVELHETWQAELPRALRSLLNGDVWVPSEVLLDFVRKVKLILENQLVNGQSLTAREAQVLQLLFRRLSNKEIAAALEITERTAKFHVSHVLSKLNVESRKRLLQERFHPGSGALRQPARPSRGGAGAGPASRTEASAMPWRGALERIGKK